MNSMQIAGMILFVAAIVIFIIWQIKEENKRFRVVTYEITSDKIRKPATFAVLADLHNYVYGTGNEKLMKAIDEVHPDGVISAGDMVEAYATANGTSQTMEFLGKIQKKYPFYYGMGNHEHRLLEKPEQYPRQFPEFQNGILQEKLHLLQNECIDFTGYGIHLVGLDLERIYFRKFKKYPLAAEHITECIGAPKKEGFNLLIGHNPDHFESYASWGADLVLSGHVHGGMIALPGLGGIISPQITLFPKYDGGEYHEGKSRMILSRGLGNHSVHIRIFNRAELVVLKLMPGDGNRT